MVPCHDIDVKTRRVLNIHHDADQGRDVLKWQFKTFRIRYSVDLEVKVLKSLDIFMINDCEQTIKFDDLY